MSYIGRQPQIGNFQICDAISVVNGQAAYTMQVGSVNVSPESALTMIVSLNGVIQKPNSSFTVSGSTITFSSNLVTGDVINFIQIFGNVLDLGVPSDATVTAAKVVDGAITSAKLASGVGGVAGITSNADATAITIDSDEKVGIGTGSPNSTLTVSGDLTVSRAGDTVKADFSNGVNANFRVLTSGTAAQIGPSTASDIVFLSSNAERMRMLAAGGLTFGGDTAAANALSDYEEGSFTPAYGFDSGSVTMQSGSRAYYVKVGNLVHFQIYMATDAISSPSGDATITGLPFTTGDNNSSTATIGLMYRFGTDFDGDSKARMVQNGTIIQLWKNASNSSSSNAIQGSDFSSGSAYNNLHIAGCYETS